MAADRAQAGRWIAAGFLVAALAAAAWLARPPSEPAPRGPVASAPAPAAQERTAVGDRTGATDTGAETAARTGPGDSAALADAEGGSVDRLPSADATATATDHGAAADATGTGPLPATPLGLGDPPAAGPDAAPAAPVARLDIVRVDPTGEALLAGRAPPGSMVEVLIDGKAVGSATADASGAFVAFVTAGISETPRQLTLRAGDVPGDPAQGDVVVLLPRSAPARADSSVGDPPPASAAADAAPTDGVPRADAATRAALSDPSDPEGTPDAAPGPAAAGPVAPGQRADARNTRNTAGGAPADPVAEAAETGPLPPPVALILRPDAPLAARPETVLTEPLSPDQLTLGTIAYQDSGTVALSGRGQPGRSVRAYLDDRLIDSAEIGGDTGWLLELEGVEAGLYRLRIDMVDGAGAVVSRVETPFQREALDPGVAPLPGEVTVQPGDNLWRIARARYGRGIEYLTIFTANADLIRDPDLIFPGQIFALPEID